ncbi:MAG: DUF350 domain-containing protein [Bacteroidales bacterium]|nr:DUF350 domain-containing protein [Bacteroidales bacterium]
MNTLNVILAMDIIHNFSEGILSTAVYAIIGIIAAVAGYFIVDLLIPGNMGKQIAEEKNMPIAIVAGAMILGICIIIAASIVG